MANILGKDYISNTDLSENIEQLLSQLNGIAQMADEYVADIDDLAYNYVKSLKKVGSEDKIKSFEQDFQNNQSNINNYVSDLQMKIMSAKTIENETVIKTRSFSEVTSSNALSNVFAGQLNELRNNIDASKITEIIGLDSKVQNCTSEIMGKINSYSDKIIKGLNVENLFKQADELINMQSILNEGNMTLEKLTNLEFWQEDLSSIQEIFNLDDFGNFVSKDFMNNKISEMVNSFSEGKLLNGILPDNFNDQVSKILTGWKDSGVDEINKWISQLPENFESIVPQELMQNYSDVMSGLLGTTQELVSLGQAGAEITNAFLSLPNNIMDSVNTVAGKLTNEVQSQLTGVVDRFNESW